MGINAPGDKSKVGTAFGQAPNVLGSALGLPNSTSQNSSGGAMPTQMPSTMPNAMRGNPTWSSFGGGQPQASSGAPSTGGQSGLPSFGGMPSSMGNSGGDQWLQSLVQKLKQGGGMN